MISLLELIRLHNHLFSLTSYSIPKLERANTSPHPSSCSVFLVFPNVCHFAAPHTRGDLSFLLLFFLARGTMSLLGTSGPRQNRAVFPRMSFFSSSPSATRLTNIPSKGSKSALAVGSPSPIQPEDLPEVPGNPDVPTPINAYTMDVKLPELNQPIPVAAVQVVRDCKYIITFVLLTILFSPLCPTFGTPGSLQ
jgi:hypothetical protein